MFHPTHVLVSRSRKTPVELISSEHGFKVITESEWQQGSEPAFEIRSKQGFFCKGIPVVGFSLEPLELDVQSEAPAETPISA